MAMAELKLLKIFRFLETMITPTMILTSYDDSLYFQLMNFIKPGTCDMKKVVDKVKLDSLACQKQHFEVSSLLV